MKKIFSAIVVFLTMATAAFAAVNINTATKAELATLNGIGEGKAQAIIDYRTKNGAFKSKADLEKVPGIGAATLKKIEKDVSLSGKTTVAAAAKPDAKSDTKAAAPAKTDAKADTKAAAPAKTDAKAAAPSKAAPSVPAKADKTDKPQKGDAKKVAPKDDAKKDDKKADAPKK